MYAVYLGRALQTVNPPNASVGNSQTAPTIITGQTAETSIATDDTILIHDTSASALRKMTRANFVSGIGGTNTPAFEAILSSNQTVSNDTETKVQCNTEIYDTDNAYDNSTNYRFTPQTAGKYFVYATVNGYGGGNSNLNSCRAILKKNGTTVKYSINDFRNNPAKTNNIMVGATLDMNGSSDYVELYAHLEYSTSATIHLTGTSNNYTNFGAYKIIT